MSCSSYKQAVKALEVYIERGLSAIDELDHDHIDHALKLLQKQRAAWHNFIALEADLSSSDQDQLQKVVYKLRKNIDKIQEQLADKVSLTMAGLEQKKAMVKREKTKIGRFKKAPVTQTFAQSV